MNGNTAFTDVTIPESFVDNLELLELVDNKIYKLSKRIAAKGVEHFWVHDTVRASKAPATAAKNEGRQFAGQSGSDPVRLYNTAQFFMEDVQVTGTEARVEHIGLDDRFTFEAEKQEKAVAKDIERAFLYGSRSQGTYASGSQSATRQLGGIKFLVNRDASTHVVAETGTPALTQSKFNGYLQKSWTDGDRDGEMDVFTGPGQKNAISGWTTPNARNIEAKDKMVVLPVDTIATDYGVTNIHLHREVVSGDLFIVDTTQVYRGVLLDPTTEKYAARGDSLDGAVKAELTLELRRPENHVVVTGLL